MTETQDTTNYKSSLKATSLFGGVQVYKILIGVIKSKIVAVLLGPAGMGIQGLLSSTIGLISAFTNFGLGVSAVRNIAEANASNNPQRVATVINVLKKLVWLTGFLGALVTLVFAQFWSKTAFGNTDYTFAFVLLSIAVLFLQLTASQNALMQGLRKYRFLAKANIGGSTASLVLTVPLYYLWGIDAIVAVILLANIITFLFAYHFSKQIKTESVVLSRTDLRKEGSDMVKMGFFISLQGILSVISAYVVRIYISNYGGLEDVGLYNAGFVIINTYVGLVFTAMGTDYYPRLSAVASDNVKLSRLINQQAEISILLLAPIVVVFIIFIKWMVILLYSSKFLPIQGMIYWAIFAVFFKAMSWSISFSFLAKGDTKAFFWNEFAAILYSTSLNIAGYHFFGLTGLGISFFIMYMLYFLQVLIVTGKIYHVKLNKAILIIFSVQLALAIFAITLKLFTNNLVGYIAGSFLIAISVYYSFVELDKRIALKQILIERMKRK